MTTDLSDQRQCVWSIDRYFPRYHLPGERRLRPENSVVDWRLRLVEVHGEREAVAGRGAAVAAINRLDLEECRLSRVTGSDGDLSRARLGRAPELATKHSHAFAISSALDADQAHLVGVHRHKESVFGDDDSAHVVCVHGEGVRIVFD